MRVWQYMQKGATECESVPDALCTRVWQDIIMQKGVTECENVPDGTLQ
jgi:hypothetical protein